MKEQVDPGFRHTVICCSGILAIMISSVFFFDVELHIALIVALLWSAANCVKLGYRFRDIKVLMNEGIGRAINAIYIFMLIGIVIAALIESGTIAGIIYYSMDVVHPAWFLPASLLLSSFMSVATGTSWGTVGTVGVVLVGLGNILGIPAPIVAGSVVSGALFGDKMSPLSDTTILAATSAEADLYLHIRAMFYSTGPAFLLSMLSFTIVGLGYSDIALNLNEIESMKQVLGSHFSMSLIVLLPLVVLLAMSLKGIAAEPSMISATAVAVVIAVIAQHRDIADVLYSLQYGYIADTGVENIDTLLTRGGLQSMMWTLSLALIALALGGILDGAGFLRVLMRGMITRIKNVTQLVASTIATGILANMSMGENYLSIIFGTQIFKRTYRERGLHNRMLSRCVEEGTTLSAGLIPWTTTGAFFSGALAVSTVEYAPWVLLSLINIVVSIGLTAMGKGIFTVDK